MDGLLDSGIKNMNPLSRAEKFLGCIGTADVPIILANHLAKAKGKLSLSEKCREQASPKSGIRSLTELNLDVGNRVMGNAVIRCCIIVEHSIDVFEPSAAAGVEWFARQLLDMAFAHQIGRIGHGLCRITMLLIHELGEPFDKKPTINKNGNAAHSHGCTPKMKKPQDFGARSRSTSGPTLKGQMNER